MVDPDQMPLFVASDLDLHCLPMFFNRMLDIKAFILTALSCIENKCDMFIFESNSKVNNIDPVVQNYQYPS